MNDLTLQQAKELAQTGIRMTHRYFDSTEWMVMVGNKIVFEDGNQVFFNEWVEGKEWLKDGWSKFEG